MERATVRGSGSRASAGGGDRAERYLFTALPGLPAAERHVLALVELAGASRAVAASQTGLSGHELSSTLARGRKALRRARVALASGGRCERAELLLSDRIDGVLGERGARLLELHLGRCPRCREHESVLADARRAVRGGFAASLEAQPPPIGASRPALTVVPPQVQPDAEPVEPGAAPVEPEAVEQEPDAPLPAVAAAVPVPAAPSRGLQPARRRAHTVRRAALALIAAAALIAGVLTALAVLDDDRPAQRPLWDRPDAPLVRPAPLDSQ